MLIQTVNTKKAETKFILHVMPSSERKLMSSNKPWFSAFATHKVVLRLKLTKLFRRDISKKERNLVVRHKFYLELGTAYSKYRNG